MKQSVAFAAMLGAVVLGAAVLRLPSLGQRTMHTDEAVHAIKFGRLLERGEYRYDPAEYHGPSLNYLTLPVAWAAASRTLVDVTEVQLRLVPALFGVGVVALAGLFRRPLGASAALWAAVFLAASPALVFFSRYYIQETLLAFFTLAALAVVPRAIHLGAARPSGASADGVGGTAPCKTPFAWLVALGLCLGMMHATKETCVIAMMAMVIAAPAAGLRWREASPWRAVGGAIFVVAVAAAVSAAFFSSFVGHPRGVVDSVLTYFEYLGRAAGEGSAGPHCQPWYYYLYLLSGSAGSGGGSWSQAVVAALAVLGVAAAIKPRSSPAPEVAAARFLAAYAALLTVAYSAIPYKTPWCVLSLTTAWTLLAGIGAARIVRCAPNNGWRACGVAVLSAVSATVAWDAWQLNFVRCEDPENPFVYAHTTKELPLLAARTRELAQHHADGLATHVQVICPADDYWPLPWYLRDLRRVGWYRDIPLGPPAPLVIASSACESSVADYLYARQEPGKRFLYVPVPAASHQQDWELRPHVGLRLYARWDLWEQVVRGRGPLKEGVGRPE